MRKIIIDQRQEEDFKKGHIPNSINIPMQVEGNVSDIFNMELLKKKVSKEDLILIYCYAGDCASKTVLKLQEDGYKRVVNLGGYNDIKFNESPIEELKQMTNHIKEFCYKMLLCYGVDSIEDLEGVNSIASIFDSTITSATLNVFPFLEVKNAKNS